MISLLAALALAGAAAPPPPDDAAAPLADLQQMYDQSCAAREYGAYDDMCDQLRQQIHQAQVEQAREARRKPGSHGKKAGGTASPARNAAPQGEGDAIAPP